ncbi:hypothetical protein M569_02027, partial [Genlisea aurea]
MGGSRRKYKRSKPKVRVGLPRKNPKIFKPSFNVPPKLKTLLDPQSRWDESATVLQNYKALGFVSNPNFLGVMSRTPHVVEDGALQLPSPADGLVPEFGDLDAGSDLEEDDLKSALGKKRIDGKSSSLQPLTAIQRVYVSRMVEEYGDNYQAMFMDIKLNKMQHSVATLEKLCKRFRKFKDKNPLLV